MTNNFLTNIKLRPFIIKHKSKKNYNKSVNHFALIAQKNMYLESQKITIFNRLLKFLLKKKINITFYIFPKFPLTARSIGIRMGKGKSKMTGTYISIIPKGTLLLTCKCTSLDLSYINEIQNFLIKFKTKFPNNVLSIKKFYNLKQNLPININ